MVEVGGAETWSWVAVAAVTAIGVVLPCARPLEVTVKVSVPNLLSVRVGANVATPLTAVAVSVPPRLVPVGLPPASARVTVPLNVVSTFPDESSAFTVRPKPAPAVTVVGCAVTASCEPLMVIAPTDVGGRGWGWSGGRCSRRRPCSATGCWHRCSGTSPRRYGPSPSPSSA